MDGIHLGYRWWVWIDAEQLKPTMENGALVPTAWAFYMGLLSKGFDELWAQSYGRLKTQFNSCKCVSLMKSIIVGKCYNTTDGMVIVCMVNSFKICLGQRKAREKGGIRILCWHTITCK